MSKIPAAVLVVLSFVALASAQVPASGNVFFGYSYYNSKLTLDRANLNGWEGSLEGKVFPHLGIVADFSGHYGSQYISVPCGAIGACLPTINAATHEFNVLFGPRVSIAFGKWTPFGQALFGVAHINTNSGYGSDTSWATDFGGGLDYLIVKPIAWRFQGDYVRSRFSLASTDFTQKNFRFSTGIVFRF